MLTQRVLTLLAGCRRPEEILAITFTRKAAAEMRQRIVSALQMARSGIEPTAEYERQTRRLARRVLQRDAQLNWRLLSAPNRLRIQTIDGLCRDLARQLVLENGLGELPQPADDPEGFYREAVQELLAELESGTETADALASLLRHLDNNLLRLENLLSGLLAKREQWLGHILSARDARPYLEQQLQQTVAATLAAARRQLQPVAGELALLLDYAAANLANSNPDHPLCQFRGITELPPAASDCGDRWRALTGLLLTGQDSWRKRVDARDGFPAGRGGAKAQKDKLLALIGALQEIPGLYQLLLDIRTLPYGEYPDRQWQALQALTTLLPQLVARLNLVFLRHNSCDLTEITLAALRALPDGEPDRETLTDTALRLDHRIQHILIDEFQDTSSSQFQLLRRLTTGWQPDDGRTLFIVGDGMQSLYSFRSANVGLFLEARRRPIGHIQLQPLDLTVNFRSQGRLVDWVNNRFKAAFPQRDDINRGAVRYRGAEAGKDALPGEAVTIDATLDADNRQREAELVVDKIQRARRRNPAGSIAVLVRNRSHLEDIVPALYRAGLNWQAIDIEPLSQKMAVIDIHSLTRALLSPADRIAWLAILRAPWCGIDLHDLHYLANTELPAANPIPGREHYPLLRGQLSHLELLTGLSDSGQAILKRVAPILLAGLEQRGRKPLRSWVEGIWLALGGPLALLDGNDLQHVRRYLDLLEQHSPAGDVADWQAFTRALDSLYATPAAAGDPRLQLLTIHKSKGLEFDTVIIPGLDRTPAGSDSELLLWRERIDQGGEPQLLLGPLQASGDGRDALFEHLKQAARQKTRLENTRVIYVGATRAIDKLHLLFNLKSSGREGFRAPAADSLLAPLWPAIEPVIARTQVAQTDACVLHQATADRATEAAPPLPKLSHYARLPAHWQPPAVAGDALLARYRGRAEGYEGDRYATVDNTVARHIGTVLHRTLQQIVNDGVEHWSSERIERQQPCWRGHLRQLGVGEADAPVEQLRAAVARVLADQTGRWLLDRNHADSQCELPLGRFDRHGRQRRAVVDRTFIDNGVRWVIDYKSSQPTAGQSLPDFVAQQSRLHRPQLQRYGQLFRQMESLPVRAALYFPALALFQEVGID